MSETLHYPVAALAAHYLRAGVGLAATLGVLLWAHPAAAVSWIIAAGAILFLLDLGQTVVRQLTRIVIEESGIRTRGLLGIAIRWEDLRAVRLHYYLTRSDRRGGWMQLEVRGARRSISVESSLAGFARLAARLAREADARGLPLDAATRENLELLDAPRRWSA